MELTGAPSDAPPEELDCAHAACDDEYCCFDGRRVLLNKLVETSAETGVPAEGAQGAHEVGDAGAPRMEEVSRSELLWRLGHLQSALFTSYGTDYEFLLELLGAEQTLAPAATRRRGVVVVDNYDHHRMPAGLDESKYTPDNLSVPAFLSVVLPPFFAAGAAAAERTRVHHGTMHPKLWLLCFDAGGPCAAHGGEGFLRLIISSANLGRYDAKINNQVWACDFVRRADAARALAPLSREELLDELRDEWRSGVGSRGRR